MLKIAQSTRPQFRRNLAAVAAASLFYASTCPNVSHAQWFGPSCRSLAQEQLSGIGPRLTEWYGSAATNNPQAYMAVALTGAVGTITLDRPIEVEVRSVEATAIERTNVQTRCRVRAPAMITFGRPGIWVEETSTGPRLQRGNRDDTLEGEIAYDFVFAGREVLESGLESFMVVALVTYSTLRQREEQADPAVQRLIREQQAAEHARRASEAQARSEAEQRQIFATPPAQRPRIRPYELDRIREWANRCWEFPRSLRDTPVSIRLVLRFSADGRILGRPLARLLDGGPEFQELANTAANAIIRCSSEGGIQLPRERYAAWAEAIVDFRNGGR